MREGEKATVAFLDGYLYALANFCYGCNFVPIYGAEELFLNDGNIEKALIQSLGSKDNYSAFTTVEISPKTQLETLIIKWIAKKLFEGKEGLKGSSLLRFSFEQHKRYFLEFIVSPWVG